MGLLSGGLISGGVRGEAYLRFREFAFQNGSGLAIIIKQFKTRR